MKEKINSPKLPPVGIIKFIEKIRNFLNKSAKKMIPANFALLEMSLNFFIAKAIYVAAELNIADILKKGPKTIDELAEITKTHQPSLYRLMRALASQGIFKEKSNKTFILTPMAKALQEGEGSMKYMILHFLGELNWDMFSEMLHCVKTGENAVKKISGMEFYEYLALHPENIQIFNKAMTNSSEMAIKFIVSAYDFSGIKKLIDIGGGQGFLLSNILYKNPLMKGILFDQPKIVSQASKISEEFGVSDRCSVETGNFFESVPQGADAYILKNIIHNWDDKASTLILKNIHNAIAENGKLLLIEAVIEENNEPSFGKLLDLQLLVGTNEGRERTRKEFEKLYYEAGFKLTKIIQTATPFCFIEGMKKPMPI